MNLLRRIEALEASRKCGNDEILRLVTLAEKGDFDYLTDDELYALIAIVDGCPDDVDFKDNLAGLIDADLPRLAAEGKRSCGFSAMADAKLNGLVLEGERA